MGIQAVFPGSTLASQKIGWPLIVGASSKEVADILGTLPEAETGHLGGARAGGEKSG